ncbi:winged helix DNA-binding domain-containing protein, partial [Streptomyces caeruleatus]
MEPLFQAFAMGQAFHASGMTVGDAAAILPDVFEFTRQPRTGADLEAWLRERLGAHAPEEVIRSIRMWAP